MKKKKQILKISVLLILLFTTLTKAQNKIVKYYYCANNNNVIQLELKRNKDGFYSVKGDEDFKYIFGDKKILFLDKKILYRFNKDTTYRFMSYNDTPTDVDFNMKTANLLFSSNRENRKLLYRNYIVARGIRFIMKRKYNFCGQEIDVYHYNIYDDDNYCNHFYSIGFSPTIGIVYMEIERGIEYNPWHYVLQCNDFLK